MDTTNTGSELSKKRGKYNYNLQTVKPRYFIICFDIMKVYVAQLSMKQ